MEQKNTIVKCHVHPNCLFNYNGVCDNYVITIGEDGKCQCYVETAIEETSFIELKGYKKGQPVTLKIAELNKPNKNKSTIRDVVHECDLPICDWSCKHALRSGPSFNPDLWCDKMKGKPAVGLFCSDYEEEKPIVKIKAPSEITFTAENVQWNKEFIEDQMCWYCDHGKHGKCKFLAKPMRNSKGECCRFTSTGGNR